MVISIEGKNIKNVKFKKNICAKEKLFLKKTHADSNYTVVNAKWE